MLPYDIRPKCIETWLIEAEWHMYASENKPSLIQIMASLLLGAKRPIPTPPLLF